MGISSEQFVKEIQQMVRRKHSKDHPIIGLIEDGKLDRGQLKGFVGQFYLFFPKPFPKPIAAMLSRCPDDPELEKMWIENVVEEGTGEITGTDSHKGLFIRFANACGYGKEELDRVEPLPETEATLDATSARGLSAASEVAMQVVPPMWNKSEHESGRGIWLLQPYALSAGL